MGIALLLVLTLGTKIQLTHFVPFPVLSEVEDYYSMPVSVVLLSESMVSFIFIVSGQFCLYMSAIASQPSENI